MSPQITTLGTIGSDPYHSMRSRLKTSGVYRPEDNAVMQNYRYQIDCYDESPYEIEVHNGFFLSTQVSIDLIGLSIKLYGLHFSSDGRFLYISYKSIEGTKSLLSFVYLQLTVPWYFTINESDSILTFTGFQSEITNVTNPDILPGGITSSLDGLDFYTGENIPTTSPKQALIRHYSIITGRENFVWNFQGSNYSNVETSNLVNRTNLIRGIKIHPDGTKLFVMKGDYNFTNSSGTVVNGVPGILQYTLSSPWSITSMTYNGQLSLTSYDTDPTDMEFSSDGRILYFTGLTTKRVYQVTLNTPWDVVNGINSGVASKYFYRGYYTGHDSEPRGFYFNPDGLSFYILGSKYLTPPLLPDDSASTSTGSITRYGLIIS